MTVKKNGRMDALRHGVIVGGIIITLLRLFIQDWMGLSEYIVFLEENWINIPWWIWPPIMILAFLWLLILSHKYDQLDKGEPIDEDE